jgi:hypothetical protein
MNRLLTLTLAATLIGGSATLAHGYKTSRPMALSGPPRVAIPAYGYDPHGGAAGFGAGLVALGVFAALAAPHTVYYEREFYRPRHIQHRHGRLYGRHGLGQ